MTDIRDGERVTLVSHDPLRARHPAMLEFGSRQDFGDPSLAYRRLFSELLGTFLLVVVVVAAGILHAKGQISLSAAVVAPGVMVMAIILFMGALSGAHLNPVVSVAFALRGDFSWRRALVTLLSNCSGRRSHAYSCLSCSATARTWAWRCPVRGTRLGRRSCWRSLRPRRSSACSRDRVGGPERRHDRCARGRRLHRPG